MDKELYFDIVSDEWSGGLYRMEAITGVSSFYYHHSFADLDEDRNTSSVSETYHSGFAEFWEQFTRNNRWFTFHPLYIHPLQRQFVKEELGRVNWKVIADEKWREMYQRQWNKALNAPVAYYKPNSP